MGLVPFLNEDYAKDLFPIGHAKEKDDRMFDASSRSTRGLEEADRTSERLGHQFLS